MADTYKIVRVYFQSGRKKTLQRGLTLKQAQEHCSDPKTEKKRKDGTPVWMDCFYKEE